MRSGLFKRVSRSRCFVPVLLVLRFEEEGFPVMGFDVDPSKVSRLNRGECYVRHLAADRGLALVNKKQFEATSDFTRLSGPDCTIICVPTSSSGKVPVLLYHQTRPTRRLSRSNFGSSTRQHRYVAGSFATHRYKAWLYGSSRCG